MKPRPDSTQPVHGRMFGDNNKKNNNNDKNYDCWKLLWTNKKYMIPFLFVTLVFMINNIIISCSMQIRYNYYEPLIKEPDYDQFNQVIDITLLGDSLINFPFEEFNLGYKIYEKIKINSKNMTIRIHNAGVNGNTIYRIRERLETVLKLNSSGLILYWDSNLDHLDEQSMNSSEVASYRHKYEEDLRYVIERTLQYGTDVITVAGPGIYVEGPFFVPMKDRSRNFLLDEYRRLNANIVSDYGIPYTDLRQAFLDTIPTYWIFSRWYVTVDGEHPNGKGALVIAKQFAGRITQWILSK